ncbi:MAG: GNAT family N-acetyltransferase [Myxococcaceae bacterium]
MSFYLEIFDPTSNPWEKVKDEIIDLENDIFGDETFDEETLKTGFENPDNTIIIMRDGDGRAIGYAWATPAKALYKEEDDYQVFQGREASENTAYIYSLGLRKEYQGKGLVVRLYDALNQSLLSKGYTRLHRDAEIKNGLAANILKNNQGKIINNFEHDSPYGKQMFIDMWIPFLFLPSIHHDGD